MFWDEIQLWIVSFLSLQKQSDNKTNWMQEEETKIKQTNLQLAWIILSLSLFCFSKMNFSSYFLSWRCSFRWIACLACNSWQFVVQHFQIHLWGHFCSKKAFHSTKQNWKRSNVIQWAKKKKESAILAFVIAWKNICLCFDNKGNILTSAQFCLKWKTKLVFFVGIFTKVVGWVIWCLRKKNKQNQQWSLKNPGFICQTTWQSNHDYDWNWKYKVIDQLKICFSNWNNAESRIVVVGFDILSPEDQNINNLQRLSKTNRKRKKKKEKKNICPSMESLMFNWRSTWLSTQKFFKKDWI